MEIPSQCPQCKGPTQVVSKDTVICIKCGWQKVSLKDTRYETICPKCGTKGHPQRSDTDPKLFLFQCDMCQHSARVRIP